MNNINFKINQEDRSVNIKCNISDYLISEKIVNYIKAARRMQATKIIIEIDNQYVVGEKR